MQLRDLSRVYKDRNDKSAAFGRRSFCQTLLGQSLQRFGELNMRNAAGNRTRPRVEIIALSGAPAICETPWRRTGSIPQVDIDGDRSAGVEVGSRTIAMADDIELLTRPLRNLQVRFTTFPKTQR